jgi:hypothetical protein
MSDAAQPVIETPAPWRCPNCRRDVESPFCARCGERPIAPADLTLRGALARLGHALTSVDGRVVRTFLRLVRQPGALTKAYVDGQRKPFAPPFSLFLIANVLFFAVQSLTGINVLGSSLDSNLHRQDWQAPAQALVAHRLEAAHTTLAAYAPAFDRAAIVNAKALVVLMVLPFAGLVALAFNGRQRSFMAHLAFSLHFYAFVMLLFTLVIAVTRAVMALGGPGLDAPAMDTALSLFNLAASGLYIHLALGAAYGVAGAERAVKAVLLVIAAAAIVIGYRFAIFLITLYTA